jgi:hypothetical protein
MSQKARNVADQCSGFLKDKKYLIHHRDPLFTEESREILNASGIRPIRTLPMARHLSCIVGRFIRSIKSECLDRMLLFGERHLEYIIKEYMKHYHTERAPELLSKGHLTEVMNKSTVLHTNLFAIESASP